MTGEPVTYRPTAVLIRGNPNVGKGGPYARFYRKLNEELAMQGFDVTEDAGEAWTLPKPADLWLGFSRGAGRLQYAPEGVRTLPVGSKVEGAINHPDDDVHTPWHLVGRSPPAAHAKIPPGLREKLREIAMLIAQERQNKLAVDPRDLILVTGHSGAGKSYTAGELGKRLGLPVVSIDDHPDNSQLFKNDPDNLHLVRGSQERLHFFKERQRIAREILGSLQSPSIVEGSQLAQLSSKELQQYPNRVLVKTPLTKLLEQRIARVRAKALAKGKPWDDEIEQKRFNAGREIYDGYRSTMSRAARVPGTVIMHNHKQTVDEIMSQLGIKQAASPLVAAGLCVLAADTGRVLMLQRAFDDADPASGKWEFPGGHIERGETPLEAAKREWEEEVGCRLPAHLQIHVDWRSGIYVGYVGSIPSEKDLKINNKGRRVLNPDDPDRDNIEIVAWWKPKDIKNNPVIRRELARVYKDKVHWAIKLSQLQLRRLDTMQKTAAVNDLIKNLASTSTGSAMLGAGVGAGAGALGQVLKPKEERDYAGGALLGAGLGAGAGYGVKQLANSDPGIEHAITQRYEATRRLLRLMMQPAGSQKLGGVSKTAQQHDVTLFDGSAPPPSINSLRQAGNSSTPQMVGAGLGALGGGTLGAVGGAALGSGVGLIREMLRKRKEDRSLVRGMLAGGGIGAGVGAGVGGIAGGAKGLQAAGVYQRAMRDAADTLERAESQGSPIQTVDALMEAIRGLRKRSQWGGGDEDVDAINHLCSLTSKQASRLSAKLAVRALLQAAGADAIEMVMNQRAVQAKAAGILDNIKATLADPDSRPYASALIGSGVGALGGAAKSLLMDDPEERSVLRSALLGAGLGGLGGGMIGKFTNPGPEVVNPQLPPNVPAQVEGRQAGNAVRKVMGGTAGALAGGAVGGTLTKGTGTLTEGAGELLKKIGRNRFLKRLGVGLAGRGVAGVGRVMQGQPGRALGLVGGLAGGAYGGGYLADQMYNKQSGFASLTGPLGKGYTDRVSRLANPPKEPKESKAPAPTMPGPMILNPNGTPVGTQTPTAPTGIGGMPAPSTMPKMAGAGEALKWISDKWADPTNRAMMGAVGGAAAGSLGMLGAEALSPDKKRRRYLNAALTGALGGAAVGGGLGQLSNLASGGVPDRDLSEVEANILKTPGGVERLNKQVQSRVPGIIDHIGNTTAEIYNASPMLTSAATGGAVHYGTRNNPLLQNWFNTAELANDPQMVELRRLFSAAQSGGTVNVGGQTKTLSEIGDLITKRTKDIHAGTGAGRFAVGRGVRKSLPGLAAAGLTFGLPAAYNWMRGE